MDSCEVLVFNINKKNHHEDMFLAKQNIQWWDEWIMISQMFFFVMTSISVSRITRALWKSITVYDAGFTMIAVIPKFKLTVWSIYMMFDDNYFRQMCVCLSTQFKHLRIGINISIVNCFPILLSTSYYVMYIAE
jgi:hypothetical protein